MTDANKHIMRGFMRICEAVKNGHIEPRHISTKLNLSDLFTKSVPKEVIDSLYESMRGAGIFPAMPPSAYDERTLQPARKARARNSTRSCSGKGSGTIQKYHSCVWCKGLAKIPLDLPFNPFYC